jgi:aconitate hydratase
VVPSIAGPRAPQDRIELTASKRSFRKALVGMIGKELPAADADSYIDGKSAAPAKLANKAKIGSTGNELTHGDVVIAAITSCNQHLEPVGADRRRPARQEGGREGPDQQALGQDQPRARLAGGH